MKLYENMCKATHKPKATENRENSGSKCQGDADQAVVRAGWGWLGKASQSGVGGVCGPGWGGTRLSLGCGQAGGAARTSRPSSSSIPELAGP